MLEYAYLNSHFQSGLKNLLDIAVLEHHELGKTLRPIISYEKSTRSPSTSTAGDFRRGPPRG